MSETIVDLSGCVIFDIAGTRRVPLLGQYSASTLAAALIEEWVPYFECHKCGRFEYCKFVERLPHSRSHARDIKCGVAVAAIHELVHRCFDILPTADQKQRQHFVDGAFHFFQFVYKAELQIGNFLDGAILDWWSTWAPASFGQLAHLRSHLDAVAHHLGRFQAIRARQAILLVEGWSEKSFVEQLKQSGLAWFLHLNVRQYGGRGNRRPGRIELLLEEYRMDGYSTYLQGDADGGRPSDVFSQLISRKLVDAAHTFVFQDDFESCVPLKLLFRAVRGLEELDGTSEEAFLVAASSGAGPVGGRLMENLGLNLEPLKVPLALAVADQLNATVWWQDKSFMETELGRFLDFLCKIE